MSSFINSNIKDYKPKVILDIGSRDLEQSIEFKSIYPDARIIAFEANPEQYKICKQAAEGKGIEVYPYLLSDKEQEQHDFYITPGNIGASSMLKPYDVPFASDKSWIKISIKSRRLDKVLEELGVSKVDIVWIDVQGAELKVLQGMNKYLDEVDFLHVEAADIPYYEDHHPRHEVENFLSYRDLVVKEFIQANPHPYHEGDLLVINRKCLAVR